MINPYVEHRFEDASSPLFYIPDPNTGDPIYYWDQEFTRPFDGEIFEIEDGVMISEVEMKDGYKTGIEKQYYPTGIIQSTSEVDHNTKYGLSREYYESGELKNESVICRNAYLLTVKVSKEGKVIECRRQQRNIDRLVNANDFKKFSLLLNHYKNLSAGQNFVQNIPNDPLKTAF